MRIPGAARAAALFTLISLGVIALTACGLFSSDPEVRYRITVEVDTPEGVRTGSGVWSFKLRPGGLTTSYNSQFRGEAVAVDLPGGNALFATVVTLSGGGTASTDLMAKLPEDVLLRAGVSSEILRQMHDREEILRYISELETPPIPLNCEARECPLLVRFPDPTAPSSVQEVDPNDLSSAFGPGIRLRRITLQITRDPISSGIDERLPWLQNYHRGELQLDGQQHHSYPQGVPLNVALGSGAFSTELD